jgi:chromosome segregation ATPase
MLKYRKEVERKSAMAEDALKETAASIVDEAVKEATATGEKHPGIRLASGELVYLLQHIDGDIKAVAADLRALDGRVNARIDRLDDKIESTNNTLTAKIESVYNALNTKIESVYNALDTKIQNLDTKLDSRIDRLDDKVDNLNKWAIGLIIAVGIGLFGIIANIAVTLLHH